MSGLIDQQAAAMRTDDAGSRHRKTRRAATGHGAKKGVKMVVKRPAGPIRRGVPLADSLVPQGNVLVGARGFEPPTTWPPDNWALVRPQPPPAACRILSGVFCAISVSSSHAMLPTTAEMAVKMAVNHIPARWTIAVTTPAAATRPDVLVRKAFLCLRRSLIPASLNIGFSETAKLRCATLAALPSGCRDGRREACRRVRAAPGPRGRKLVVRVRGRASAAAPAAAPSPPHGHALRRLPPAARDYPRRCPLVLLVAAVGGQCARAAGRAQRRHLRPAHPGLGAYLRAAARRGGAAPGAPCRAAVVVR